MGAEVGSQSCGGDGQGKQCWLQRIENQTLNCAWPRADLGRLGIRNGRFLQEVGASFPACF